MPALCYNEKHSMKKQVWILLTANVFVNIPVKSIAKAYTYQVPESLAFVSAGWRVFVPFGGRKVEGFILSVGQGTGGDIPLKPILAPVDEEAWFTPAMIETAQWMADFYLCSLAETMRLFMPGKSGLKIDVMYEACPAEPSQPLLQVKSYAAVYGLLLQHGGLAKNALKKALPSLAAEIEPILDRLLQYHLLKKEYQAKKRGSALYEKYVVPGSVINEQLLASYAKRPAQRHVLELLQQAGAMTLAKLKEQGASPSGLKALSTQGMVEIRERRVLRDSYQLAAKGPAMPQTLTAEQEEALRALSPYLGSEKYQGFLLYGVTGSGKTRVYIEAVSRVRQAGKTAIVLVPEIALTGQLVASFKTFFENDIIVMHSRLTVAERNDAILRIRRGDAGIVIGARSALFTPVSDLGILILDEEQDMSYKQDEAPRYHARVVAGQMARIHKAVLLLGSATPSMESFYQAQRGAYILLRMPKRIGGASLPQTACEDMRQELRQGNRHVISRALESLIVRTIERKQQIILMLNRRGFSTFVMCRSCGHVMVCTMCGMPLVYHKNGTLVCHHCDIQEPVPDICPACGSSYIKYFGSGTEKLERELAELVPAARIIRMDRDTTTGKFSHANILAAFKRGEYDILLGTQMVAKGHDIPNVTAVGIISADSSLNMPDFRAAERCFMLITQTAGRAGRGNEPGYVLVQSYNPEHYAVRFALQQDYEGFFAKEIELRRQLFFPPFCRLVKLTFQNEVEAAAQDAAKAVKKKFQQRFTDKQSNQIIGPAPAGIAKFRGIFRYCLLIKTAQLSLVQEFLRTEGLQLRTDVLIDIDPLSTL